MKKVYTIIAAGLIIANTVSAKTYKVSSGRWTDAKVWNNEYPGNVIKSDDVVIITGQITMNTGIVVEGTLQVEKGACMVGMKDLVIAKSGKFVNNGNTVMKRIYNEGSISNNLLMEAMMDVDNKGAIENNNNMVAGNNFDNLGGRAAGNNGAYFVNNNIITSPASSFGNNVLAFYGSQIEKSGETINASPFTLDAAFQLNNGVVLNISSNGKNDASIFSIEKSNDGKNFTFVDMMKKGESMTYTDTKINSDITYYRVKAISASGEETILPVATVKAPDLTTAYAPAK